MPFYIRYRACLLCGIILCLGVGAEAQSMDDPMAEKVKILTMSVMSPAVRKGRALPATYTCAGDDENPPILVRHIPLNAKSLVIVIDSKVGVQTRVNWAVYNIPVTPTGMVKVPRYSVPGQEAKNSSQRQRYTGPCLTKDERATVAIKAYALKNMLRLPADATAGLLARAMKDQVVAKARLLTTAVGQ
ncbi:MAG TPA: hypothetical protein DCR55_13785 [Lentisphaeria bacterium]|nr:hypothetical protein [Lentisphaeria bacterium]